MNRKPRIQGKSTVRRQKTRLSCRQTQICVYICLEWTHSFDLSYLSPTCTKRKHIHSHIHVGWYESVKRIIVIYKRCKMHWLTWYVLDDDPSQCYSCKTSWSNYMQFPAMKYKMLGKVLKKGNLGTRYKTTKQLDVISIYIWKVINTNTSSHSTSCQLVMNRPVHTGLEILAKCPNLVWPELKFDLHLKQLGSSSDWYMLHARSVQTCIHEFVFT